MAIWGQTPTVDALIAKGKHDKAIELIAEQRKKEPRNVRLRLQLCDVLAAANRGNEAVPILLALVDELAEEGFFPKAIAVLKKVQRIDPLKRGVEEKLADLCADEHGRAAARRTGVLPAIKRPEEPNEAIETFPDMDLEVAPTPPDQSPLFSDFARDELVEVIRGLNLLSFQPGDILITEGEPGESLLVISSGSVKAFVKNKEGRNVQVREMKEGEFFGEISLLSGSPRTATITASTSCDLLELDRGDPLGHREALPERQSGRSGVLRTSLRKRERGRGPLELTPSPHRYRGLEGERGEPPLPQAPVNQGSLSAVTPLSASMTA